MKYTWEYDDFISEGEKGPFARKFRSIQDAAEYAASKLEPYLFDDNHMFLIFEHDDADGMAFPVNLKLLKEKLGLKTEIVSYSSDLFANPPQEFLQTMKEKKKNLFMLVTDTYISPPPVPDEVRKRRRVREMDAFYQIEKVFKETANLQPPEERPKLMVIDHHVMPGIVERKLNELKEKYNDRVDVIDLKYGIEGLKEDYPCVSGFSYLVCNKLVEKYERKKNRTIDLYIRGYKLPTIPAMIGMACDDRIKLTDEIYRIILKENPRLEGTLSPQARFPIWIVCNAIVNDIISVRSKANYPLRHQEGVSKAEELMMLAAKIGEPAVLKDLEAMFPDEKALGDMLSEVRSISWTVDRELNRLVSPTPRLLSGSDHLYMATSIIHGRRRIDSKYLYELKVNRKIVHNLQRKASQQIRVTKPPEEFTIFAYGGIAVPEAMIDTPGGIRQVPFMECSARLVYARRRIYRGGVERTPTIEYTPYKANLGLGAVNRNYLELLRWEEALKKREIGREQFYIACPLFRGGGSDYAASVKLPIMHKKGEAISDSVKNAIVDEPDLACEAFGLNIKEKGCFPALKLK